MIYIQRINNIYKGKTDVKNDNEIYTKAKQRCKHSQ